MLRKKTAISIHLVFWVLFIGIRFIRIGYAPAIRLQFPGLRFFDVSYLVITALVFYINYFFLLPFFSKKNPVIKYLLPVLISYVLFLCIRYGFEQVISPAVWGYRNYYGTPPLWFYAYDNLYYAFPAVVISTIMWVLIHNIRLMEENAQMKVQQASAEIKFLKAQVNPHFIFNTLNNIYALVFNRSQAALPAIEALAGMMRFTTYEAGAETVFLTEEVQYIDNLIALEQLRHEAPLHLQFKKSIANEQQLIPPFMISPFIENALKHGMVEDAASPVTIVLETTASRLTLEVTNKISTRHKDAVGGVGLENIKRRLNFYYPNRHRLQCATTGQIYNVYLQINF
ncbi:histidine kinase [Niabella pedocola]|uniref:Histidine kinase n=1 Tax=Niabella pedocola TaxID=1752077 RepID=A0ABS8PT69_9BACT|nr:histidine kinase [Niabella pedocola]MCD2424259.1 histidine kinase [Niabella pedocola]